MRMDWEMQCSAHLIKVNVTVAEASEDLLRNSMEFSLAGTGCAAVLFSAQSNRRMRNREMGAHGGCKLKKGDKGDLRSTERLA